MANRTNRNARGAGRKPRPLPWGLWCMVRAVMVVHGYKHPRQACADLFMRQKPEKIAEAVFDTSPFRGDASRRRPRVLTGEPGTYNDAGFKRVLHIKVRGKWIPEWIPVPGSGIKGKDVVAAMARSETMWKEVGKWHRRSIEALTHQYYRTDRRRRGDKELREDCDYWLPHFIEAERTGNWPHPVRESARA